MIGIRNVNLIRIKTRRTWRKTLREKARINNKLSRHEKQGPGSDLTDEKFRSLIVRKIDDIKSRKDLPTSISFFKEGVEFLYAEFDEGKFGSGYNAATAQAVCAETLSLT